MAETVPVLMASNITTSVRCTAFQTLRVDAGTYGAYVQDTLKPYRLTAVPGIRVDFDDYMQNLNVSPRFSSSYDVWGDRSTELFCGMSRYYAGNVLAYKLREARAGPALH